MKKLFLFLIFTLLLPQPVVAEELPKREFSSGYAGSLPSDPGLLARTYFNHPSIRKLIYEMESGPATKAQVEEALKDSGFGIDDLLRVNILREHGGQFFIAFNYFTRADMEAIYRVAEERTPSLVEAYLQRREEFEAIFEAYPAKSVSGEKIAFVLIAGISLNWDGLNFTLEQGLRKPNLAEGEGWQYSFWAAEDVPDHSTREFIWGSSTFPLKEFNYPDDPVDFAFSSFGDPYSDPRMNFPDLMGIPGEAMEPGVRAAVEKIGLINEDFLGLKLENVLGFSLGRDLGALLFALRGGAKGEGELAVYVREPEKLSVLLDMLVEIQYVGRDDNGCYFLLVPVLDHADKKMVDEALALSREVLSDWFAENYEGIRSDLGGLTSMTQGVPFEALFTQIWHDFFGQTTREMAHAGFIFNTYGEDLTYKASLGSVWRHSLYNFDPK